MRFPLELWRACREIWPAQKPMSVRISATDWAPGGLSGEDLIALTRMLKEAGCDLIDCSSGQTVPHQKPVYGRMYQAPFSDWVRRSEEHTSELQSLAYLVCRLLLEKKKKKEVKKIEIAYK